MTYEFMGQEFVETLDAGIKLVQRYWWHIIVGEKDGEWVVWGGEIPLFKTDNLVAVETFLYGMALSYSVWPDEFQELVDQHLGMDYDAEMLLEDTERLIEPLRTQGWTIIYS